MKKGGVIAYVESENFKFLHPKILFNHCFLVNLVNHVPCVPERNPVRAGMVGKVWEYPWSSAKYHAGGREADDLVKRPDLWRLRGNWREYIGAEEGDEEKELRSAMRTGRPWVGEGRLARLERITGRDLGKGKLVGHGKVLKNNNVSPELNILRAVPLHQFPRSLPGLSHADLTVHFE